jgi:hypothetical protein
LIKKVKKAKGRPRSETPMVHTAIVLPQELLEQLKRDAEADQRGLSAEIRHRLRLTYLMESRDDRETTNLLTAIRHLSDISARDLGKRWHEHPYAMAAFKAGVAAFLARYQPEGDESVRPDTKGVGEPADPPDVVGRTHARLIGIAGHEEEDE